jgi:hypothetical protein
MHDDDEGKTIANAKAALAKFKDDARNDLTKLIDLLKEISAEPNSNPKLPIAIALAQGVVQSVNETNSKVEPSLDHLSAAHTIPDAPAGSEPHGIKAPPKEAPSSTADEPTVADNTFAAGPLD